METQSFEKKIYYSDLHKDSTLDEVWDFCARNIIYNMEKFADDMEEIFQKIGISKDSIIADFSAGGGFPALELIGRGYKVDCFDGFSDELFNKNAQNIGLSVKCQKVLWQDLPKVVNPGTYDFIFCRGNSFIYADGGWISKENPNMENALIQYTETMKILAETLKEGGFLYIDKFKDTELGHRDKLGSIRVGDEIQDLFFYSNRFPDIKLREVFLERSIDGQVCALDERITYDLSEIELLKMMEMSGFLTISKIQPPAENHFDVWLAKK